MIKLISFIVFIAAFTWTWFLFNSENKINVATHAGIQSKLMILIEDSLKKAKPEATEFKILSMYTEKIDDNQVNAHFSYKYTDKLETTETTNQTLSGNAILFRTLSENSKADLWTVKSVKTNNTQIEFQQGVNVNAATDESVLTQAASTDATPAAAPVDTEEKKNQ
jgi:hypothetical protein